MDRLLFSKINEILMNEEKPSLLLNNMKNLGQLQNTALYKIEKLSEIDQNREFHPEGNVWNHICMVVDNAAKIKDYANDKEALMWAAFMHDIGKLTTTKMIRGKLRSYDHDIVGEKMAYDILKGEYSEAFAYKVSKLVRYHMHHIFILKDLPFKNMKGLIRETDINDLMLLFYSDKMGRGGINKKGKEKNYKEIYLLLEDIEKHKGVALKEIRDNISLALR